jgi:hypothetical protein
MHIYKDKGHVCNKKIKDEYVINKKDKKLTCTFINIKDQCGKKINEVFITNK